MARKRFSLDISAWCEKARANPRTIARKVVLDLGTAIVEKTPVGDPDTWAPTTPVPAGYVGGRARGSWQYAKGSPADGAPDTIDPGGSIAIDRVAAGVASGDPATEHFITSNLPYMRRLEYEGWSGQAPDGMVRKSVEEFQTHIENAIRELP